MDPKLKRVHQDLENKSDLKTKREKIRMSLAKASKHNKRVKNGKKVNIQPMQRELEELNKQIDVEAMQSIELKENSPVVGLSQKKCHQMDKVKTQADEKSSLEGITTLSSSLSETCSEADSGISSPRGKNLSKAIPPYENFKRKMDSLIQTLNKRDETIKLKQDKITSQNKLLEGQEKEITNQNKLLKGQENEIEIGRKQAELSEKLIKKLEGITQGQQTNLTRQDKASMELIEQLEEKDLLIQDLEKQLEGKELLIKNIQQSDSSSKELLSEMEKFEKSKLQNKELLEKLKNYEDLIVSLESKSLEMENQLKDKQENIFLLQHEKENVLSKWKIDLQDQTGLSEKLSDKEKEIRS